MSNAQVCGVGKCSINCYDLGFRDRKPKRFVRCCAICQPSAPVCFFRLFCPIIHNALRIVNSVSTFSVIPDNSKTCSCIRVQTQCMLVANLASQGLLLPHCATAKSAAGKLRPWLARLASRL